MTDQYPRPGTEAYRLEAERATQEKAFPIHGHLRGSLLQLCQLLPSSAPLLQREAPLLVEAMHRWDETPNARQPVTGFRDFLGVALVAHDYEMEIDLDDWNNFRMGYDPVPIYTIREKSLARNPPASAVRRSAGSCFL